MGDTGNQDSEPTEINADMVTKEDIKSLINLFAKKSYNAGTVDPEMNAILERCIRFLELDYSVAVVQNDLGELSYNYPHQLPILEYEKRRYPDDHTLSPQKKNMSPRRTNSSPQRTNLFPRNINSSPLRTSLSPRRTSLSPRRTGMSPRSTSLSPRSTSLSPRTNLFSPRTSLSPPQTNIVQERIDVQKVRELFNNAKFSRCRTRFPIPVIMYKGKYICRSSTLSRGFEMYGRNGLQYFDIYKLRFRDDTTKDEAEKSSGKLIESAQELDDIAETPAKNENVTTVPSHFFEKIRNSDIKLLKYFKVETIIDIMVENQKVKYGM
nr:uncharacterized protein LOC111503116 [Leptinotarsa decemlineata]XP_023013105.1 uncharacterized protein LOC111503116 [Leptinotarsa decemlineata]